MLGMVIPRDPDDSTAWPFCERLSPETVQKYYAQCSLGGSSKTISYKNTLPFDADGLTPKINAASRLFIFWSNPPL